MVNLFFLLVIMLIIERFWKYLKEPWEVRFFSILLIFVLGIGVILGHHLKRDQTFLQIGETLIDVSYVVAEALIAIVILMSMWEIRKKVKLS